MKAEADHRARTVIGRGAGESGDLSEYFNPIGHGRHHHRLARIMGGAGIGSNIDTGAWRSQGGQMGFCGATGVERPGMDRLDRMVDVLWGAGVVTTVRDSLGRNVDAACGQLVGRVDDRTARSVRLNTIPVTGPE